MLGKAKAYTNFEPNRMRGRGRNKYVKSWPQTD